ncbi:MAG: [Alistipes sp.]|nr:[FeFe] hydrogenase H-cluster maturation GTPase HydF [Alistipes sp.]
MTNQTPHSERTNIALFGRCNSGKSSLINALTAQATAIVSDEAGTTTDPVIKAMEITGVGASIIIDTAGFDDTTPLGVERTAKTLKILERTDIAIVLFTDAEPSVELDWMEKMRKRNISIIATLSQCDRYADSKTLAAKIEQKSGLKPICISAHTGEGLDELRAAILATAKSEERLLTEGFCKAGDTVLLVMPQDEQAPKGRLIKPQVQTLRELLDRGCNALCCTAESMESALKALATPPQLIITDSQVFDKVYKLKPEASVLTSFSVLFARYKGDINLFVEGAKQMLALPATARILIAEACTHTPQNEDIGRVKLPRLLRRKLGEELQIEVVGGNDFPEDLTPYDLVIHCGACMFNRRHVMSRVARAEQQKIPITNYGIAIAALMGILGRIKY